MLLGAAMNLGSLQAQLQKQQTTPEATFLFITSNGEVFVTSDSEPLQVQPNS